MIGSIVCESYYMCFRTSVADSSYKLVVKIYQQQNLTSFIQNLGKNNKIFKPKEHYNTQNNAYKFSSQILSWLKNALPKFCAAKILLRNTGLCVQPFIFTREWIIITDLMSKDE